MQAKKTSSQPALDQTRRHFLHSLGALVGVTTAGSLLTGNALSVAMAYTPQQDSTQSKGKLFSQAQLIQLKTICARVIPKTDTLGAAEVDTHGFIDNQLFYCHNHKQQKVIITLLDDINLEANKLYGNHFSELSHQLQITLLNQLERGNASFEFKYREAFKQLKSLICFGYYTSEVGASEELRYLAIPGGYKGSIPYKKTDTNWGSQGLFY